MRVSIHHGILHKYSANPDFIAQLSQAALQAWQNNAEKRIMQSIPTENGSIRFHFFDIRPHFSGNCLIVH